MCRCRLTDRNCVRTKIRFRPLLMQLLIGMSIRRYLPAIGTAGSLRLLVSGYSPAPRPPPRIRERTSCMVLGPLSLVLGPLSLVLDQGQGTKDQEKRTHHNWAASAPASATMSPSSRSPSPQNVGSVTSPPSRASSTCGASEPPQASSSR